MFAGFLATLFSAPADVIMTSYQTACQRGVKYTGLLQCAAQIWTTNGILGFFNGWPIQFFRVAPLFAVNLPLYEQFRKIIGLSYMN